MPVLDRRPMPRLRTGLSTLRLVVLEIAHVAWRQLERYRSMASPYSRVYLVERGRGRITGPSGPVELRPGRAFLIPLQAPFDYDFEPGLSVTGIHLRVELFPGTDVFEGYQHVLQQRTPPALSRLRLDDSADLGAREVLEWSGPIHSLLAEFLTDRNREKDINLAGRRRHAEFFRLVDQLGSAQLRVKEVAGRLGVATATLSRQIRRDVGYSPKDYIAERLLMRAQELLLLDRLSVKATAARLQFSDEFHFSRFFKRLTRMSPREYCRRNAW